MQWVWPALLVLLVWVIPESPHHLVRQGRLESASSSLTRLHNSSADIPAILQDIVSLAADEKAAAHDMQNAKYIECFKGDNWRRTRIILYANGLGQMVGVTFLANGPYFLVSAGMSATRVAMMVELGNGIGIIGNVATWISLVYFGRRQITLVAIALAALLFLPMGIAGCFPTNSSALW